MAKSAKYFIDEQEIELADPENLRLTISYAIQDINNLGKNTGSVSKTSSISGTASNKNALGFPEDIGSLDALDQTVQKEARWEVDGIDIIKGVVKLTEVIRNIAGNITEYKIVTIGNNGTWVNQLLGLDLRDIDFSDQNHIYDKATIDTSETIAPDRHYVYPLINYGEFQDLGKVVIEDRFPALNVHEIITRIFKGIKFTINSDFFNSDFFKRLYVPFTQPQLRSILTEDEVNDRKFRAGIDATAVRSDGLRFRTYPNPSLPGFTPAGLQKIELSEVGTLTDTFNTALNEFDTSDLRYEAAVTGSMKFVFKVTYSSLVDSPNKGQFKIRKNGVTLVSADIEDTGSLSTHTLLILETEPVNILPGDTVDVFIDFDIDLGGTGSFVVRVISTFDAPPFVASEGTAETVFFNIVSDEAARNLTVDMNRHLPRISQIQFIQAFRDLFDWQFDTDVNKREVFIEPRKDFYLSTSIDWTKKIDASKNISIKNLGDNLNQEIRYRYLNDNNDGNVKAIQEHDEFVLASQEIKIANKFAKKELGEKTNPVFAPTFMDFAPEIGVRTVKIPKLWTELTEFGEPERSTTFESRVLYYDGVKSLSVGESWEWEGVSRTDLPHIYSFNDLEDNDNSLYFNETLRSNGLFEKFFKSPLHKTIDEGVLVSVWLNLNEVDISNLNFRKPVTIKIDNEPFTFILNKVINYNPLTITPTQVELLQLIGSDATLPVTFVSDDPLAPPPPESTLSGGKTRITIVGGKGSPFSLRLNANNAQLFKSILLGAELVDAADEQIIMGRRNVPDANAQFILGIGNDDGAENAFKIDEHGNFLVKGGYIVATINGSIQQVYATIDNNLQPIVKSDDGN